MRAFIVSALLVILTGCTSAPRGTGAKSSIVDDYIFSQNSRYAGRPLRVLADGGNLFVLLEGHKMPLKPEGDHYRFTTGDKVWNKDRTVKVLEWFIIAYDPDRQQYYMGSPENTEWQQYLTRK